MDATTKSTELVRMGFDLKSSVSRQHYIDTGRYLIRDEILMERALEAWRELYHDIQFEDMSAADTADEVYRHLNALGMEVS